MPYFSNSQLEESWTTILAWRSGDLEINQPYTNGEFVVGLDHAVLNK
jgi:hypothetical protein